MAHETLERAEARGADGEESRKQEIDDGSLQRPSSEIHLTAKLLAIEEVLSEEIKALRDQIPAHHPQLQAESAEREDERGEGKDVLEDSAEESGESKCQVDEKHHRASVLDGVAAEAEDSKTGQETTRHFTTVLNQLQDFSRDISHLKKEVSRLSTPPKEVRRAASELDGCDSDGAEELHQHRYPYPDPPPNLESKLAGIFRRMSEDIHTLKQDVALLAANLEEAKSSLRGGFDGVRPTTRGKASAPSRAPSSRQCSTTSGRGPPPLHVVNALPMTPPQWECKYVTEVTAVSVIDEEADDDDHDHDHDHSIGAASLALHRHDPRPGERKNLASELGGEDGQGFPNLRSETPATALVSTDTLEDRNGFVAASPGRRRTRKQICFPGTPNMLGALKAGVHGSAGGSSEAANKPPPFGKLESPTRRLIMQQKDDKKGNTAPKEDGLGDAGVSSAVQSHAPSSSARYYSPAQSFAIDELNSPILHATDM